MGHFLQWKPMGNSIRMSDLKRREAVKEYLLPLHLNQMVPRAGSHALAQRIRSSDSRLSLFTSIDKMAAELIVILCSVLMITCTKAQTVGIYPSPRAEVIAHENLRLVCSNNGTGSATFNFWLVDTYQIGGVRKLDTTCTPYGNVENQTLYAVECTGNEAVHLTIKNIQLTQHGDVWSCSQTINSDPYLSNNTTVFVKVRVSSVTLSTPSSSTVTVHENTAITFNCTTSLSRPAPTVSWYMDGGTTATSDDTPILQTVSQSPAVGSEGYVATTGSLTYKPSRTANGKSVFCQSKDDDGHTLLSDRKILLNITYKPKSGPFIHSYNNIMSYKAIANKQQILTCSVIGGNPLASLSWSCFTGSEEDLSSGQNVSKRWTWTSSTDGTCKCISTHLGDSEEVVLNVKILSPPTSPVFQLHSQTIQGSATVKIIRDSSAPITCSATSSPPPDKYVWKYNGQSIVSQAASLSSSKITADGQYSCQVRNRMTPTQGQAEYGNNSAYINVERLFPPTKPVLKYSSQNGATLSGSFKVVKEDNFNMHCSSTAKPSPIYLWTGDGRNVQNQVIAVSSITQDRVYTCKVTNTMEPTFLDNVSGSSSTTVSISVLSPPKTPTKTYHYSQSGSMQVSTMLKVIKGNSFNVSCAATAVPDPSLAWSGPKTSGSGTLVFTSVLESHDGAYTCTARNYMNRTFGAQEEGKNASDLHIQVLYAPSVTPFNVDPVVEGETLYVQCKSAPGNPASTIYSWKRKLSSSSGNTWQDIPGSTINGDQLQKQNINRTDAGTYNCTASNVMEPTAEKQQIGSSWHSFILNVFYKASISRFFETNHSTSNEVTVSENSSISLQCEVDSNPGSTIDILKNGEKKTSKENTKQITYSNSKVSCDTAGIYSCVGYNNHNKEMNKPNQDLRLFVTCSPRLKSPEDFERNITSALNKEASLKITVVAYPVPKESDYVWQKRNGNTWNILKNDTAIKINTTGLDSSLIIRSVRESDFQQYRVKVSNSFGQFRQEFFLNPQDLPKPPENVDSMDGFLTETSVVITWNPGFDGGLEQTFVILYKIQGELNWLEDTKKDDGTESMNITLKNLAVGTTYAFRMFSRNSMGNSSATDISFFTTIDKKAPGGSNAAVIGGAAGGSVVILIAGIVVFFVRRGSFKKGTSKSSSERSDRKPVYEDENEYGMQDNPMYVSAGPRPSNSKAGACSSADGVEYSTVNKTTKSQTADDFNDNEYAVVNKTNKAKAKPGKKEKTKQAFFKDKKGKKVDVEGDIYENSPSKDLKAAASKDETIYENPEASVPSKKKNVNKDGLIYADLTFNDQPKGQKKLVIHGLDSMTEYVQVDFTKKADPLPESDDENIPPKN